MPIAILLILISAALFALDGFHVIDVPFWVALLPLIPVGIGLVLAVIASSVALAIGARLSLSAIKEVKSGRKIRA